MVRLVALGLILTLSACSGGGSIGSLNPFNWFGGGRKATQEQPGVQSLAPRRGYAVVPDTRILVDQISNLTVERTPSGIIVRATGLPASQGYYQAELIPVASNSARVRSFEFRIRPPTSAPRIGTPFSREVNAAVFLTSGELAGVRQVRVVGSRNSRTGRR